jgi:ketosteroid isomerase-like protein
VDLEEKVELARRMFQHLADRRPARAVECLQRDAEFDFTRSRGPNRGTFAGRARIQKSWEEVLGMWEEFVLEPHDFVGLDSGDLLFSIRGRMVGRDGIELTVRAAHIWEFTDGLISYATFFQTREDALRAAGLPAASAS